MVRARKRRKEMIKKIIFILLSSQPRHFVLHIPNTPPHHHLLLSKNKNKTNKENKKNANRKRSDCEKKIHRRKRKNPNLKKKRFAKCQTNPKYDSEHQVIKFEKQFEKRWCFSLKKTKIIPFIPPPPT